MASWMPTCCRASSCRSLQRSSPPRRAREVAPLREGTVACRSYMKRAALLTLKIGVSLALLAYLFGRRTCGALEEKVRTADLLDLLAAVFFYAAMLALAAWRWQLLLARPRPPGAAAPADGLVPDRAASSTTSCPATSAGTSCASATARGSRARRPPRWPWSASTASSGSAPCTCSPPSPSSLAPAPVRGLAGARAVLLGLALLFGRARLRVLPAGHRRPADEALAARRRSAGSRERFETVAGRGARLPRARRRRLARRPRQPRRAGAGGALLPGGRPRARHPAARRRPRS